MVVLVELTTFDEPTSPWAFCGNEQACSNQMGVAYWHDHGPHGRHHQEFVTHVASHSSLCCCCCCCCCCCWDGRCLDWSVQRRDDLPNNDMIHHVDNDYENDYDNTVNRELVVLAHPAHKP